MLSSMLFSRVEKSFFAISIFVKEHLYLYALVAAHCTPGLKEKESVLELDRRLVHEKNNGYGCM